MKNRSHIITLLTVLFLCANPYSVFAAQEFDESEASVIWSNTQDEQQLGAFLTTGDFNGDGTSDLAVGAPYTNITAADEGQAYILNGSSTLRSTSEFISAATDITLNGATASELLSEGSNRGMVRCNLNADSYDDLLIPSTEGVYIFYGPSTNWGSMSLSDAALIATANKPDSIACGDFNNDTFDDFATSPASYETLYVVYGSASELTDGDITTIATYQITTEDVDNSWKYITAGDFDGDGSDDIAAADQQNASDGAGTGAIYVFYGDTLASGTSSAVGTEITGTSDGSQFGYYLTAGDITNDGKAELFVRNPETSTSVLIIPGSATRLTGSQDYNALTTSQVTSARMRFFATSDVNGDGINDLLIGGDSNTGYNDKAHIIYGTAGAAPSGLLADVEDLLVADDSVANTGFAEYVSFADMNGDGYNELYAGAKRAVVTSSGDDGLVYAFYFYVDVDGDGTYADASLASSDADCDDTDATAADLITYYADSDGDNLGDSTNTTTVCSNSAPDGYVADGTDTNDNDFDNDGTETEADCDDTDNTVSVEIVFYADTDEDGLGDPDAGQSFCSASAPEGYVANSDDVSGELDLVNADPAGTEDYSAYVGSIAGIAGGQIQVEYTNDTSATYEIFDTPESEKLTQILSFNGTGYILVLHPQGKKIALVNAFTGTIFDTVSISKKKFPNRSMKLLDLRGDGSTELVVTMKKGKTKLQGRIAIVKVKTADQILKKKETKNFESKKVRVGKTKKHKKQVLLRNKNSKKVIAYKITKKYTAQLVFPATPQ